MVFVFGGRMIAASVCGGFAVAGIAGATREDAFGGGAIHFAALGLEERAFVPVDAEPFEGDEDSVDELGFIAFDVGIFDAENERAAFVLCVEPVEERGAGAADVEIAGGRWGEADARICG